MLHVESVEVMKLAKNGLKFIMVDFAHMFFIPVCVVPFATKAFVAYKLDSK